MANSVADEKVNVVLEGEREDEAGDGEWIQEEHLQGQNGESKDVHDLEYAEDVDMEVAFEETVGGGEEESYYVESAPPAPPNLLDLLSRTMQVPEGEIPITLCFSKRCLPQLTCNGFLYNISATDPLTAQTWWHCVSPICPASLVTTANYAQVHQKEEHHSDCLPDEPQVRLRIAIYDLRLMAEFMVVDLRQLYDNFVTGVVQKDPMLMQTFPPFSAIERSLDLHRRLKVFRRRFENNARGGVVRERGADEEEDVMVEVAGNHDEQGVILEEAILVPSRHRPHTVNRVRQRPFPQTTCMECGEDTRGGVGEGGPQECLVSHLVACHERASRISTYTFEPGAFEVWLREVQLSGATRMRRFQPIDGSMYFLCAFDDRIVKNRNTLGIHCPAFIRILDYHRVTARQAKEVTIFFSLEHAFHHLPDIVDGVPYQEAFERFSPDVFLQNMELRRRRTEILVRSNPHLQRIQRPAFKRLFHPRPQVVDSAATAAASGSRLFPDSPDVYGESREQARQRVTRGLAEQRWQRQRDTPVLTTSLATAVRRHKTERGNFRSQHVYETVLQTELQCEMLVKRLQFVRNEEKAERYLRDIALVVNKALGDVDLQPVRKEDKRVAMRDRRRKETAMGSYEEYEETIEVEVVSHEEMDVYDGPMVKEMNAVVKDLDEGAVVKERREEEGGQRLRLPTMARPPPPRRPPILSKVSFACLLPSSPFITGKESDAGPSTSRMMLMRPETGRLLAKRLGRLEKAKTATETTPQS